MKEIDKIEDPLVPNTTHKQTPEIFIEKSSTINNELPETSKVE